MWYQCDCQLVDLFNRFDSDFGNIKLSFVKMNTISTVFGLCLIAFASANPLIVPDESSTQHPFEKYPFDDMYKYMTCVPNLVDQLAMEYSCEEIWNDYREDFLNTIDEYETCSQLEDENKVEAYVSLFKCFYYLKKSNSNSELTVIMRFQFAKGVESITN